LDEELWVLVGEYSKDCIEWECPLAKLMDRLSKLSRKTMEDII
jgi:hypothetical protein